MTIFDGLSFWLWNSKNTELQAGVEKTQKQPPEVFCKKMWS